MSIIYIILILIVLFIYLRITRKDIFWDIFNNTTCRSCKEKSTTSSSYLCKKCNRKNKISISLKNGFIKSIHSKFITFLIKNRNIIDLVNFISLLIIASVKLYLYGLKSNIYYDIFIIYFWIYNIYISIITSIKKTI